MDGKIFNGCAATHNYSTTAKYLFHLIAYHTAPVLEKEKPAVLLNLANERDRQLHDWWLENRELIPQGAQFRFYILNQTARRTTVLFYNPEMIAEILQNKKIRNFLKNSGYQRMVSVQNALDELALRFREYGCPHEIGIFLGIPLSDVLGFIKYGGKQALADGCWKVYDDPERKIALFARYQEAKQNFIRFIGAGYQPWEYLQGKTLALAR